MYIYNIKSSAYKIIQGLNAECEQMKGVQRDDLATRIIAEWFTRQPIATSFYDF